MGWVLLAIILAIIFFGVGFTVHVLWVATVVALFVAAALWLLGYRGGSRHY